MHKGKCSSFLWSPIHPPQLSSGCRCHSRTKRRSAGAQLLMHCLPSMCSINGQAGANTSQSPSTAPAGLQRNFHHHKNKSESHVSGTLGENRSVENVINEQQTRVWGLRSELGPHVAVPILCCLSGEFSLGQGDLLKNHLLFRAVPWHSESLQGSRLCADSAHDRCCKAYTRFISSLGCKETQTFYWPSGRENNFLPSCLHKWGFILVLSLKLRAW